MKARRPNDASVAPCKRLCSEAVADLMEECEVCWILKTIAVKFETIAVKVELSKKCQGEMPRFFAPGLGFWPIRQTHTNFWGQKCGIPKNAMLGSLSTPPSLPQSKKVPCMTGWDSDPGPYGPKEDILTTRLTGHMH